MLSTRVFTFLGWTAYTRRTTCCNSCTVEVGSSSYPDPCLVPNMLSGVHVWTLWWAVHDLHIIMHQKSSGVTYCVGRGVVLDIHKVSSKNAHRPGKHTIVEKRDVALAVEGSIKHHSSLLPPWWITPHTMTEGPRLLSVSWMHASIGLSPCLQCHEHDHHCKTVRLSTEDIVPPVPEVSPPVRSSPHMAALPVIQSQSGTPGGTPIPIASSQKPVYHALNWQHHQKSADHLSMQTSSWDETIVNDHSVWLSVSLGCGQTTPTSKPLLMWLTNVSGAS